MTPVTFYHATASRRRLSAILRMRDTVMTILLWMVYLLFMKGFFLFVGDVADWAWHGFAGMDRYPSFAILPTLLFYSEIALIFITLSIGWARYNQFRFRGRTRRRAARPVASADLAAFYGLDEQHVKQWQLAKTLAIHHDSGGRIVGVEPG